MRHPVVLLLAVLMPAMAALAGPFAYINQFTMDDPDSDDPADVLSGNLVSVLDLATGEFVTDIEVGLGPRPIAVDAERSRVYVGSQNELIVSAIDTETNTVIEELLVDLEPNAIAVNPKNGEVYVIVLNSSVSNSGGVQIFDSQFGNAEDPETVITGNQPVSLAVMPDGQSIYIGGFADQTVTVMDVDTRALGPVIPLGSLKFPAGMLASPDGSRVYVSDFTNSAVYVIETASNSVVDTINVQRGADDMAQTPDGSLLYVANVVDNTVSVVDTLGLIEIESIDVGDQPRGVDLAADGTLVVTSSADDTVQLISDVTKTQVTTIDMPFNSTPFSNGAFIIGEAGSTLELDARWSGAFFDPTQDGHGFLLQVLSGGVVLVYWFTFDSSGNPTWFFGLGTIDGDTITVPLQWEPDGPFFPPFFDPDDFMPIDWGTLVIRFLDCDTGVAEWDSLFGKFGSGDMDLERITNTATLECENQLSGR